MSWASLVITLLAAIAGIAMWTNLDSSLALVFGLENCVDFISSAVVLWRFFAPFKVDPSTEQKLQRREKRASVAISFILFFLGIAIFSAAINDFRRGQDEPYDRAAAFVIAFFSIPIFATLTVIKFRFAHKLDSASLYKDGICSLIGTVLAAALFVNIIIVENSPESWWADPLIALFAGFFAMFVGVQALYVSYTAEQLPIFSVSWWTQGDAADEMSGRPVGKNNDLALKPETSSSDKKTEDGEDMDVDMEIV